MFKYFRLYLLVLILLLYTACSSEKPTLENNQTANKQVEIKIEKIAAQPLIYHDNASISQLSSGYGTFGIHEVGTKEISNSIYDYNQAYKDLNLTTKLYYPKDSQTKNPTLFFYSGYGVYNPDSYKALFYFVASKGYNIIFMTCPRVELRKLTDVTQDAINAFEAHIDKTKVGFLGHSMGAGVSFWQINQHPSLGSAARILFPMASGYTLFNDDLISDTKQITLPSNTKMIQQVYAKDYTTDVRIGFDLFVNNSISSNNKEFMFLYGDTQHASDHGACTSKGAYHYNAFMQRTIFRPLDALMDEAFNNNLEARSLLKAEIDNDAHFHPYIGTAPQDDIASEYILSIESYPFNCHDANGWESKRKDYCSAFGL